jgi:2-C-methyl-D-erythritol 4-phosphate cytidylyltransferase
MGSAERPKQYLRVAGRTLLEWAAAPLLEHPLVERVVIVLAHEDRYWQEIPLATSSRVTRAQGGAERADSVKAGLTALSSEAHADDWVLVHDAARPCLSDKDLDRLMTQLRSDPVGGLLAIPLVDTLKRADEEGFVAETVPRAGLWRAMTPQMFRFGVLERALTSAAERGILVTDEAQAVEMLGLRPKLVEGSADNLKITTAPDLERAARVLAARGLG